MSFWRHGPHHARPARCVHRWSCSQAQERGGKFNYSWRCQQLSIRQLIDNAVKKRSSWVFLNAPWPLHSGEHRTRAQHTHKHRTLIRTQGQIHTYTYACTHKHTVWAYKRADVMCRYSCVWESERTHMPPTASSSSSLIPSLYSLSETNKRASGDVEQSQSPYAAYVHKHTRTHVYTRTRMRTCQKKIHGRDSSRVITRRTHTSTNVCMCNTKYLSIRVCMCKMFINNRKS